MADNIDVTPGSGKTVAADDIGGVLYQRIKPATGPDGTANDVSVANPMPVGGGYTEQASLTAGSLNADLVSSTDVSAYRWFSIQITGTWSGTLTFQESNDNSNFTSKPLLNSASTTGALATTSTGNAIFYGPITAKYLRVRMTAYTSGTANGTLELFTQASAMQATPVTATQTGTWTVQPGNTANSTPWLVTNTPATSGGWLVDSRTALSNTVVSSKASAGQLGGYYWYNPNASAAYIQIFNVASGSVTLGSTTPTYVLTIPASGGANLEFVNGIAHSTAISYAATTTATGSSALGSSLTGFMLYK